MAERELCAPGGIDESAPAPRELLKFAMPLVESPEIGEHRRPHDAVELEPWRRCRHELRELLRGLREPALLEARGEHRTLVGELVPPLSPREIANGRRKPLRLVDSALRQSERAAPELNVSPPASRTRGVGVPLALL